MKRRGDILEKPTTKKQASTLPIEATQTRAQLECFTLDQLKAFLRDLGVLQKGKKPELIDRVFRQLFPHRDNPQENTLFSFKWEGLLLGNIPQDLHSIIQMYLTHRVPDPPTLKRTYTLKRCVGNNNLRSAFGITRGYGGGLFVVDNLYSYISVFHDTDGRHVKLMPALSLPQAITFNFEGNLAVVDFNTIHIIDPAGKGRVITSFSSQGSENGQILGASGITVDLKGNYVVADSLNHRLQIFSLAGDWIKTIGKRGEDLGEFNFPTGVAVDLNTGNIVCVDHGNNRVQIFTADGDPIKAFGKSGSGPGEFTHPWGVALDRNGSIVVAGGSKRLQIFDRDGQFIQEITADKKKLILKTPVIDQQGDIICVAGSQIAVFG